MAYALSLRLVRTDGDPRDVPPHIELAEPPASECRLRAGSLARDLDIIQSRVKRQRLEGEGIWPAGGASLPPAPHLPVMERTSASATAAITSLNASSSIAVAPALVSAPPGSAGGSKVGNVPGRIEGSGFCTTGGAIDQRAAAALTPNAEDSWR